MPLADLETTLEPLLLAWKEKGKPRSSFGNFVEQLGQDQVRELLAQAS